MTYIRDWEQAARNGPLDCGGKGWNLGRAALYGFRVPAGGVIAADLYRRIVALEPIKSAAGELASVGALQAADASTIAKLDRVRALIEAVELPPEADAEIRAFLRDRKLEIPPVAVRSSATAEDSAAASFAGIHRSYLNVRGPREVIDAVRGCWASLWTPQALAYRRRMNITDDQLSAAVVICEMVGRFNVESQFRKPVCAGVAFTCDPQTGRRDVVAIGAVPGLGEDLVSGKVNAEEIQVVFRNGDLHFGSRRGRPDLVLSDALALRLARLCMRVHWAFGEGERPQDIEWAYDGRDFVVLQVRPVTHVPRVAPPQTAGMPVMWSNANLKDAVAGVPTTLGWSLIQTAIRHILFAMLDAIDYAMPPGLETVRRHQGRAYFDLTLMQWFMFDAVGLIPAELNRSLGGHQPEIPLPDGGNAGKPGLSLLTNGLKLIKLMLFFARKFKRETVAAFAQTRQLAAVDIRGMTDLQLRDFIERIRELGDAYGPRFQIANATAGLWPNQLELLLTRVAPARARAITAGLLSAGGQITSAEHGYRLFSLADAVRRDPAAAAWLGSGDPAAAAWLGSGDADAFGWRKLPAGSAFRIEMERFLYDFGHRGVYECEVANPRWNEEPGYLLDQVRAILQGAGNGSPRGSAQRTRAAAERELDSVTWLWRPVARWLAGKAREAAGQRELSKSAMAFQLAVLRSVVRETGRRMVEAGKLRTIDDVFHLSMADLDCYLRGEWDGCGAVALAAERKAQRDQWLAEEPPDVIFEEGGPIAAAFHAPKASDGRNWSGMGVASGHADGLARIIRHPDEGGKLRTGEVLVAPSTDPGWTPLFLRASAVVMETGGYLSHGAIVAREYGLPAVVNIPGLLSTLPDGSPIHVDGDAGRVSLTSKP